MRIIHTADWHIGQTLNGWTREAEHRAFLGALPDIVEAHDADAMIIAGDVFDGINPSADAMQMLYQSLVTVHRRRPRLTTVMIAGNHDPAGRLQAPAMLLATINVHVVGTIQRREGVIDPERHLIPLRDRSGAVAAHVLAVPFLRAADLPGLGHDDGVAGSPVVRAIRRLYLEGVSLARSVIGDAPLIATGHLHCSGCTESEGAERRILVGGEHAVPDDVFPADLAYVALGHLHRPQMVGRETVRYSGSLFPLSATELPYEHGFTVVDIEAGATTCTHVPFPRPVRCLRIPEVGSLTIAGLDTALSAIGADPECPVETQPFVHVVLRQDGPAAGLAGEAERVLESYPVRNAGIRIERPQVVAGVETPVAVVHLADCDPADLFRQAFLARHGFEPEPAHRTAFHQLLATE